LINHFLWLIDSDITLLQLASMYLLSTGFLINGSLFMAFAVLHGQRAEWEVVCIKGYHLPIPEFALQTAIDVKTACPEVALFIEELRTTKDPFLVAKLGGETYYLEVWNEPGFKQERVV
jgi:hypothetical protein